MPRPIWSGSISFGLVNVPVKLSTPTENHTVSFHQFRRGTAERIRNQRIAEKSGEPPVPDDIEGRSRVSKQELVSALDQAS